MPIILGHRILLNPLLVLIFLMTMSSSARALNDTVFDQEVEEKVALQVDVLNDRCRYFWYRNTDSAMYYCQKAVDIAQKINYDKGLIAGEFNIGVVNRVKGDYQKALKHYFESLTLAEIADNKLYMASNLNAIGVVFKKQNEYEKALNYFIKATDIVSEVNDTLRMASVQNNIGEVYTRMGNHEEGLAHYRSSLHLRRATNYSIGIVKVMNNIGELFISRSLLDSASYYFEGALVLAEPAKYKMGTIDAYIGMAKVAHSQKRYERSIEYIMKGLTLASQEQAKPKKLMCYGLLRDNFESKGDYLEAFQYQNEYMLLKDSIFNEEKAKKITLLELEREEAKNQMLRKDIEIRNIIIEEQRVRILYAIVVLALAVLSTAVMVRFYLAKRTANQLLTRQKQDIETKNHSLEMLNEEITRQNESINEQKLQLEKSNELKNKLISVVSHDVRTPLSGLHSMLELVNISLMSEAEFKQLIPKIASQLAQTIDFLTSVLYWARGQIDQEAVVPQLVDIYNLVEKNIALMSVQIEKKNISVISHAKEGDQAYADVNMVNLVVKNLLTNALKFTSKDGEIVIDTLQCENTLQINVSDSGIGMEQEQLEYIFKRAYNKSSVGTSGERGTGMGLAFCKDFIEKNGGTIWAKSKKWEGSTFSFTLPLYNK